MGVKYYCDKCKSEYHSDSKFHTSTIKVEARMDHWQLCQACSCVLMNRVKTWIEVYESRLETYVDKES